KDIVSKNMSSFLHQPKRIHCRCKAFYRHLYSFIKDNQVKVITDDLEKLYATEEFLVEGHWEDQRRLNMIPGGKSGLRYLREHGLISNSVADQRGQTRLIVRDVGRISS
ncbi:MAG: hypothetical protein ACU85E_18285, partial [Gammaproteobacteria bacterium]